MRQNPLKTSADITQAESSLLEDFALLDNWEERYSHIIDLGAKLPPPDEDLCQEENRIHGCVSQVWLKASYRDEDNLLSFVGFSDSTIVCGLIALLFTLYQNHSPQEILAHDPKEFFLKLGLVDHLSPSRGNGFYAMMQKIHTIARAHI